MVGMIVSVVVFYKTVSIMDSYPRFAKIVFSIFFSFTLIKGPELLALDISGFLFDINDLRRNISIFISGLSVGLYDMNFVIFCKNTYVIAAYMVVNVMLFCVYTNKWVHYYYAFGKQY